MLKINNATSYAKFLNSAFIREGDTVIDATAGNGFDTVFLSKAAGKKGRVYAFDIQKEALEHTKQRLQDENCFDNVVLLHNGHEHIASHVKEEISAAMFNLGYLPGGCNALTTKSETTLEALRQCLVLLKKGGLISLCIYTGHEGGAMEYKNVHEYAKTLNTKAFDVLECAFLNKDDASPILVFIQKI